MAETAVTAPSAASAAPAVRLASVWLTTLALGEDGEQSGQDVVPADPSGSWAFLTAQSAMLLAILFGEPFRPAQASAIGQALVRANFVAADVLGRSLRVLMLRLPEMLTDYLACPARELERRVAEVSGALANGYVHALRDRTLAEQESLMRTELDAQRSISQRLMHEATHDPLTGLPNRAAIFAGLSAALDGGHGDSVGVCYVDLDGFKAVNDRYGHQAGDELLITVSRRICETAIAFGALPGRIGGDEFIVVADASPGASRMIMMARAILAELSRPVALRIGRVCISACAGIAERATGSATSAEMVADADAALYRAKSRGPGRWAIAGVPGDSGRPIAG
ncbi:GGDEF domain-containing protein [Trebonia kvetii]|uniref:GGDEF domain-containing protein n=1 Tax=Trebonia kvetii TaxID=2480626 RepID=A0A6P2BZ54_9ACTN|nr:GGDEF domain-containing protein [Trebonia kvetii]TVZ03987.1 GGDEF domain-containing protein [Trebonia kvetii]